MEMTNLNRNVQGMFAEFVNQFGKETGGSSSIVFDRQIVFYTGDNSLGRKVEDQNPKGNGVDFDTSNNENVGHGGTDFEFHLRMSLDHEKKMLKLRGRFHLIEKGNKFRLIKLRMKVVGGEEPKKYLFEGTFVSKRMFDVLNFCPSFDLVMMNLMLMTLNST
ncbi:Uncharacterized protein Fot_32284 [Forsythia ovata]|uniref:Uncharacterized protein n=1 Tax=Forsythia ovata TaxID=205694 RepID=A0ABD1T7F2_9LAMI